MYYLPYHGGLRIFKALSDAELITLPTYGGLRIYRALNSSDLVFLTGCQHYGQPCLHILIDSLIYCSCGVFMSVNIISCLHILIDSLLHCSCGLFVPIDIIILVKSLYTRHSWYIDFLF